MPGTTARVSTMADQLAQLATKRKREAKGPSLKALKELAQTLLPTDELAAIIGGPPAPKKGKQTPVSKHPRDLTPPNTHEHSGKKPKESQETQKARNQKKVRQERQLKAAIAAKQNGGTMLHHLRPSPGARACDEPLEALPPRGEAAPSWAATPEEEPVSLEQPLAEAVAPHQQEARALPQLLRKTPPAKGPHKSLQKTVAHQTKLRQFFAAGARTQTRGGSCGRETCGTNGTTRTGQREPGRARGNVCECVCHNSREDSSGSPCDCCDCGSNRKASQGQTFDPHPPDKG